MYLGTPSRSQQSPQLIEMGQLRDCEQTWSSLQRCVIVFPLDNGYRDIRYTLQEKSTIYTPQ